MPDQRSLNDQLRDLATLADERAMYDAANFLRTMLDTPAAELVPGTTHCRCGREIVEDRTPSPRGAPMQLFRNADDGQLHSCSP